MVKLQHNKHCSCLLPTLASGAQGFQQVSPPAEKQHVKKAVKGSQAALAEAPSEFGAELEVCFPSARSSNEAVLALCDGVALHGTASATAAADRFVRLCLCACYQHDLPPACCRESHSSRAGPDLGHWAGVCCLGLPRRTSCRSIAGGLNSDSLYRGISYVDETGSNGICHGNLGIPYVL